MESRKTKRIRVLTKRNRVFIEEMNWLRNEIYMCREKELLSRKKVMDKTTQTDEEGGDGMNHSMPALTLLL